VSTYETGSGPECGRYADELAELALGIATGRERAEALAHVERCSSCHAEMEQLSLAADSMLEAVPGVEPPLGFEVRLAERLGAGRDARQLTSRQLLSRQLTGRQGTGRQGRTRWFALASACLTAVVLLGAGAGIGWLVRGGQPPAVARSAFGTGPGGRASTRSLDAGGRALGYVTVYWGATSGRTSSSPSWLFMSLDVGSWSGEAPCEVNLADGAKVLLGTFWLDHGYGAWGVTLPSGTGSIRSASVVSAKGVLASAEFAPGRTASPSGPSGYSEPPGS